MVQTFQPQCCKFVIANGSMDDIKADEFADNDRQQRQKSAPRSRQSIEPSYSASDAQGEYSGDAQWEAIRFQRKWTGKVEQLAVEREGLLIGGVIDQVEACRITGCSGDLDEITWGRAMFAID